MTRGWKRWLAPGAAVTAVAVLAACGSSGSLSPGGAPASSSADDETGKRLPGTRA